MNDETAAELETLRAVVEHLSQVDNLTDNDLKERDRQWIKDRFSDLLEWLVG